MSQTIFTLSGFRAFQTQGRAGPHLSRGNAENQFTADVIVLGGGLAAQLQVRHLLRTVPDVRVAQIEATGEDQSESCNFLVEIGSLFLTQDLGLAEYLVDYHIPASGINFHWPRSPTASHDFNDYFSVWVNRDLPIQMWSIDAPGLATDLARMNLRDGVRLFEGRLTQLIPPVGDYTAAAMVETANGIMIVRARHLIDASGRTRRLGRQLRLFDDLAAHDQLAGYATMRVSGVDRRAFASVPHGVSTISLYHALHYFFGAGYWVSLTPTKRLDDEAVVSVLHYHDAVPANCVDTPEALRRFLGNHHELVHRVVADGTISDFEYQPIVGQRSRAILSQDRWSLVGDAAYDLDLIYAYSGPAMAFTIASATEAVRADLSGEPDVESKISALNEFNLAYAASIRGILDRQWEHLQHPGAMSHRITFEWLWWFGVHVPMFLGKWFLEPSFAHRFAASVRQHSSGILRTVYSDLSRALQENIPLDLFDPYRADQLFGGHHTPRAFDDYLENAKLSPRRCNVFRGMRGTLLHVAVWYASLRWAWGLKGLASWGTVHNITGLLSAAAKVWLAEWVFLCRTRRLLMNAVVARLRQEVRDHYGRSDCMPLRPQRNLGGQTTATDRNDLGCKNELST